MLLGQRTIVSADVRRVTVDYSEFLSKGVVLTGATVSIPSGATSTVAPAIVLPAQTAIYFMLTGGSFIGEQFTVNIVVTDNDGETVNDVINYTVVAANT